MGVFDKVKKQDISKLKFNELWLAHPDTLKTGAINPTQSYPCNSVSYANQCAVRMSRSAIKAGVNFADYPDPTCKGKGSFKGLDYTRGAESLANYFYIKFGKNKSRKVFMINRKAKFATAAKKQLLNKKGIIFFRDIKGFRGGIGDHIDLWNGKKTTGGEYFNESKEIWFWEIKK